MLAHIRSTIEAEKGFPRTFADADNVRIPIYYGDVGMLRPDAPLAAAAYFLCATPKSNRRFWTNALDTVLARQGMVVNDVDRMSRKEQAYVMADVCNFVAQAIDYIGDTADPNRRPIRGSPGFIGIPAFRDYDPTRVEGAEKFGNAFRCICGDCEDLALAIGEHTCSSFLEADFSDHPQLKKLQEVGHQYIAIMTLDNVTSAAVGDQGERKRGAHLKCNFLPAIWVKECMDRAERNLKVFIFLSLFVFSSPKITLYMDSYMYTNIHTLGCEEAQVSRWGCH